MNDFPHMYDCLKKDAPVNDLRSTSAWVRWMRDEGYRRRLHGDLLHKAIVDDLADYPERP